MRWIASDVAVGGQIRASDVAGLAKSGFTTIICNRPDHEEPGQPPAAEIEAAAVAQGIRFVFAPVSASSSMEASLGLMAEALRSADGAVLAYCRSGARSMALYQAYLRSLEES